MTGVATARRPRLHFAPERNWMNDPNGLVYFGGRYHLYFQHNPNGNDWGDMSWGHASSVDLVHWDEHPVALLHGEDEGIFSGSVVVDIDGSAGFGAGVLVALYTVASSRGQAQAVAWSADGFAWTKCGVVLDRGTRDFRDPKVFRHGAGWVLAAVEASEREVHLFSSTDLRNWTPLSVFGPAGAVDGIWECPDLFELDGRWVLTVSLNPGGPAGGSGQQYFVGTFDGVRFRADSSGWLDHGRDFYAGVTFDSAPGGERIMIAWMSNWDYAAEVPTAPWRGSMTLPRALSLVDGSVRQRVAGGPWPGTTVFSLREQPVRETRLPDAGVAFRIDARLRLGSAQRVGFVLGGAVLTWDGVEIAVDRTEAGLTGFSEQFPSVSRAAAGVGGELEVSVWIDATSIEVFADGGSVVLTEQIFPTSSGVAIRADGGDGYVVALDVTRLD